MLAERALTRIAKTLIRHQLTLGPANQDFLPPAASDEPNMLYMHIPFCERLCPYCSFNRYPFREDLAVPYFRNLRAEMLMLKDLGYQIESIYIGGGTPTIMIDELCETIDLARDTFDIQEVSCETNPNHLTRPYLEKLHGRVQRMSVGVQSFDDGLLRQMDRYDKYGSGEEILERIAEALPYFDSLNVDMIFNFPSQTEEILVDDLEKIVLCGCRQTTFSPLYRSNATMRKMEQTVGKVDYDRERRFYHLLDGVLCGGSDPFFERETLWTFNRRMPEGTDASGLMVEEYAVAYDQYPAIGSGAISPVDSTLFVNTFSLREYNEAIEAGHMSLMGKTKVSRRDFMRYRFLLQLYHLRLDKRAFEQEFGCTVDRGLPAEMAFMRLNGAFAVDDERELTLTPRGRYLVVILYREYLSGLNNLREQARSALSGVESQLLFGDGKEYCVAAHDGEIDAAAPAAR